MFIYDGFVFHARFPLQYDAEKTAPPCCAHGIREDRPVVAYLLSTRNENNLVPDTFEQTILTNPDAQPLIHSDRGFQFTGKVLQFKLSQQAILETQKSGSHRFALIFSIISAYSLSLSLVRSGFMAKTPPHSYPSRYFGTRWTCRWQPVSP